MHSTVLGRVLAVLLLSIVLSLAVVGSGASLHTATAASAVAAVSGEVGSTLVYTDPLTLHLPLVVSQHAPPPPLTAFGVQMYGGLSDSSVGLGLARLARAHWVRWPLNWREVEPENTTPDYYSWTLADRSIANARASGHELVVTLSSNPFWAATYQQGPIDLVPLDEVVEFVTELVERYDGDGYRDAPGSPVVTYWEFYNEPDGANEWAARLGYGSYWGDYGDLYAAMLCRVYPAVKAANPNAKVVIGGLAYDLFVDEGGSFVRDFIDDVLLSGGGSCFDIMNFHYYPAFEGRWNAYGNGLAGKATYLRSKLSSYYVSKPMIVTEAGWHSDYYSEEFPGSPEIQSRYVVKLFTQSAAAGVQATTWWTWIDPAPPYGRNGLLTDLLEPKLSFTAYQVAAEKIGTARFVRIQPTDPEIEGYRFETSTGQPLFVFWSRTEEVRWVWVPVPMVWLTDMYGQPLGRVVDTDDGTVDGRVGVYVGVNPVYMEVEP